MHAVISEVCAHPPLNPSGWFFSVLLILAAHGTHRIKEMLLTDSVTLSKVEDFTLLGKLLLIGGTQFSWQDVQGHGWAATFHPSEEHPKEAK